MKRYWPHIALMLFALQLLLMLGSWVISAAFPLSDIRSLLSGEGLRWLMGSFADILAKPLLVYLLLLAMAYGMVHRSQLLALRKGYRENRARWMTLLLLLLYIGVLLSLTMVPHAVLLSATGDLWPSPFSRSLIPLIAFGIIVLSAFYGLMAETFTAVHDIYDALLFGLRSAAPVFLFYVLCAQLYESLLFILLG